MLQDEWTEADAERELAAGSHEEIATALVWIAMSAPDGAWAEGIMYRHAGHASEYVRGNALLGLGHIARLHRGLDREKAEPLVSAGLADPSDWVRGQAECAADDIENFLGWRPGKA